MITSHMNEQSQVASVPKVLCHHGDSVVSIYSGPQTSHRQIGSC